MLLRATDVVVRHHPSHPPAVAGVSLQVAAGEVVAVVGANGSGKSTLARALVGLVPVESGRVELPRDVDGRPRIGIVLQDPLAQLIAATVADELALGPEAAGAAPDDVARVVAAQLALHDLDALAPRGPQHLSGGQQQRVAVAATTSCPVDVLVLDEPTALLDHAARARCHESIRAAAAGRAVVWITQEADELERCDRVLVLDAGFAVWTGSVREYVARPDVARTYGLDLPAAARITHELIERGAWPGGAGDVPVTMRELAARLAGRGAA